MGPDHAVTSSDAQPREQRSDGQDIQIRGAGVSLWRVKKEDVPTIWVRFGVGEMVKAYESRSHGRTSTDQALADLQAGEMQLWLVVEGMGSGAETIKAAVLTDIKPYASGMKVCTIWLVVGEAARSWIALRNEIEDWARQEGCESVEIVGRKGWGRLLDDYEQISVVYEKRLD